MSRSYDVAVIGLGGHGSAALMHAARLGLTAIGIERFDLGHAMGSSHGVHRLFRFAYAEGAQYLPLLERAHDLWLELGEDIGEAVFVRSGVLVAAPGGEGKVAAAQATCAAAGIAHEVLDAQAINRRWPAFRLGADMVGLYEPRSGFVFSERAIAAHLMLAMQSGADLLPRTPVTAIRACGDAVRIDTPGGVVRAGRAIVAAGAWVARLVPELADLHTVGRRVLGFFAPRRPADFTPDRCPGYVFSNGAIGIYGFPIAGAPGVKIGRDGHLGETGDPDLLSRVATARDEAALREGLRAFLNEADGPALALSGCVMTHTPDNHFLIDRHPSLPQVDVISACSGHGFKMASAVGEAAARRAAGLDDRVDLSPFRLARRTAAATAAGKNGDQ